MDVIDTPPSLPVEEELEDISREEEGAEQEGDEEDGEAEFLPHVDRYIQQLPRIIGRGGLASITIRSVSKSSIPRSA